MKILPLAAVAVTLTLTAALGSIGAGAQTPTQPSGIKAGVKMGAAPKQSMPSQMDKTFVEKIGHGNTAEVQLGQLAQQNASSADVKQVAQTIVTEHGAAQEQLMTLGKSKGFMVPNAPDANQKTMYNNMTKLKGAEFDKKYIAGQIKDHDATLALIQKEIKTGTSTDVKTYAQAILPKVQMHTTELKRIGTQLGVYKGMGTKPMANKM